MLIQADVVQVDVPFLAGLDVLDKFKMVVDNVEKVLDCRLAGWKLPITRKLGHLYLEWKDTENVLFTKTELVKLHRGFHLPSTRKLHDLLKRAKPENLEKATIDILNDIKKKCDTCQRHGPRPLRFRASMPEANMCFGMNSADTYSGLRETQYCTPLIRRQSFLLLCISIAMDSTMGSQ